MCIDLLRPGQGRPLLTVLMFGGYMFSFRQKHAISHEIQKILRDTNHPELPEGEIKFRIHIEGAKPWQWAYIYNNSGALAAGINPHNEAMDPDNEN